MMTFHASTVHSKIVPKERNLEHRFSRSMGTEKRIPISLKRERESAETGLARAVRNVSLNASASGSSRPTSSVTPRTKVKPNARSHAATEIIGDRRTCRTKRTSLLRQNSRVLNQRKIIKIERIKESAEHTQRQHCALCAKCAARSISRPSLPRFTIKSRRRMLRDWLSYFSVVFKGCLRDAERLRDGFRPIHPRASHRRARGLFADQCGLCALSPAQRGQHLIYRLLVHRLNVGCPQGTGAAEGMCQAPQVPKTALKRELV
jgi:hypothetical protein